MSVASRPMPRMFMTEPQPTRAFEWTQAPWGGVLRCVPLAAAASHFFTANNLTLRDDADEWDSGGRGDRRDARGSAARAPGARGRRWPSRQPIARGRGRVPTPTPSSATIRPPRSRFASPTACRSCSPTRPAGPWRPSTRAGAARRSARSSPASARCRRRYGVRPERLIAAVGPCIGPCCYEVSESTCQTFREAGHHASMLDRWFEPRAEGKFHLDLWRATRDQLEGAGVHARQHPHRRAVHEDARGRVSLVSRRGRPAPAG